MSEIGPLILVDGSSYLYRAFHALPPLTNSDNHPTGAMKGVTSMLVRLQKDYATSSLIVVFDAKGKTFRDEIYPAYKANRPSMPDDLRQQIEPIHRIVEAMGFPLLMVSGVEADDVIGTLAQQAVELGQKVVISTGDKDMAQLVNENVTLVNTMDQSQLDVAGVTEKFGIKPQFIIDYLALMGDKSDNIPGVQGIGKKTAVQLINHLGGLPKIYANLDRVVELDIRGSKTLAEKLRSHEDLAFLSYDLATIRTDVNLPLAASQRSNVAPQIEALTRLFEKFEFNSLLNELKKSGSLFNSHAEGVHTEPSFHQVFKESGSHQSVDHVDLNYQLITDVEQLNQWTAKLRDQRLFALDTETTSLNYMSARLVGISLASSPGVAAYVPFGHDYLGAPDQIPMDVALDSLKPLLEDPQLIKVGQNLKYDINVLAQHGIHLKGFFHDTMLQSYVINSIATRHDLTSLANRYLGLKITSFEDVAGTGTSQLTFNQVPIETATTYAAEDADIALRLHYTLSPLVEEYPEKARLLRQIESPLISVLSKIERAGALIDSRLLKIQSEQLAGRLKELEEEAFILAGECFNLASPKQLSHILFNKLKLPVRKKTSKGAPSTREEVLQDLASDFPLPVLLLEHRGLAKLKSTYTDKLPYMIDPRSGRVHTSYHQAGTATGRLSSSNPNLQNIPIKTKEGRRIREAFIASPGHKIVAADYSQIELRIMAHLSKDHGLMEAFLSGSDVHRMTASEVFDLDIDDVSDQQRRSAKAINFGLIYGMSAFGLAKQLSINVSEAKNYIGRYFNRYPGVQDYMESIRKQAAAKGFVETVYGRRLYLPEINSRNANLRQAAERTAINAPMQGTAADIIKIAMLSTDNWLCSERLTSRITLQVHDELVLEVPNSEIDRVKLGLKHCMETAAELDIPMLVDVGVGNNWNEAH
ncbi:MAG: DNA polymerase I [Cellvibrionales bacterium TMED148]|nr:DNA polymerase I [Porticoccaceae bacterium]RPG93429.1 MAG: DNA polymerase I [Cellvibrionales bacterium TMED148]